MMNRRINQFQQPTPSPFTENLINPKPGWRGFLWWLTMGSHENRLLRERNADLHMQNEQLRKAKPMTQEQWESIERTMKEHRELNEQQNLVIEWLRENRPEIFKNQRYAGLSFSTMIIHLLGGNQ